jgi:hypothetical protein
MYTLTVNKQKYRPNPLFGILGGRLMLPALALMMLSVMVLVILILPGFWGAMIGATRIN